MTRDLTCRSNWGCCRTWGGSFGRQRHAETKAAQQLALRLGERVERVVYEGDDAIAQACKRVRMMRFAAVDKHADGRGSWRSGDTAAWHMQRAARKVAEYKHKRKTKIITVCMRCRDSIPVEL